MLLLVSGASGVGKTTARLHARKLLDDTFVDAELFTLGPIPPTPTVEWRQQQGEAAVGRAIALAEQGRHLLFAGDPVPAGERAHATDPSHVPEAVTQNGWSQMRWSRWINRRPGPEWAMTVIDTSDLDAAAVGAAVAAWCRAAVADEAPVFHAGWHES